MGTRIPLESRTDEIWELPLTYMKGMRVPGRLFLSRLLLDDIDDRTLEQVANVATLPGIQEYSMAMPDAHLGYGFPIGGVAAFTEDEGVISPGGVGFDINCGVRLLTSELDAEEIEGKVGGLVDLLFSNVPSGLGSKSNRFRATGDTMDSVFTLGAKWAVEEGFGLKGDVEHCEENGAMEAADAGAVGPKPRSRGASQLGTLGSGNHFLEIQEVTEIYDEDAAKAFGLRLGQLCFAIHTGSRGAGHQICTDYLQGMERAARKYDISIPDRQLACAPLKSQEGTDYFAAMAAGANYAWANRQMITHWVRESISTYFKREVEAPLLYDVAHNIAKMEKHEVAGEMRNVCIHRKGATRAFPPGHPDVPVKYRGVGQPVIIPGSMGTDSYVLRGTAESASLSFSSTCHGSGRVMSRSAALRKFRGEDIRRGLIKRGIYVKAASQKVIAEEAPQVYKDSAAVVDVVHRAGLSSKVARLRPLGVAKG